MLDALELGCLCTVSEKAQSWYTLDRRYSIRKRELLNTAQLVFLSTNGMKLCPTGRDVDAMICLGDLAVQSRKKRRRTISKSILELDRAGKLGPPSLEEELLQISIGGDPRTMNVGKFVPCQRLAYNPDVEIRCACGFIVDDAIHSESKHLLRRTCNR